MYLMALLRSDNLQSKTKYLQQSKEIKKVQQNQKTLISAFE